MSRVGRQQGQQVANFPNDFLLRARWLLPVIRPGIENAWLRVRHGRIHGFGQWPPHDHCDQVIDLEDAVITAGFVNAHTHLEFSNCQSPLDTSGGLTNWIERVINWRQQEPIETRKSALLSGLRESAEAGVVAVGEIATAVPVMRDLSTLQVGPRLRIFRELLGLGPILPGSLPTAAMTALRDIHKLARAGFDVGLSPHAPYSTQWPTGRWALALAHQLRSISGRDENRRCLVPMAMHLAESEAEQEFIQKQTGHFRKLFETLGVWPNTSPRLAGTADWISLLARADRGLIVHGTYLPKDRLAWARLQRHQKRLAVAVCPRTTLALAGRLPPVGDFLKAGVRLCLGTDGRGSNPDLSIRTEAACLIDAGLISPQQALVMITSNAAWALGLERRTGLFAAGRPADLVVLRPTTNPSSVTTATASIFSSETRVIATLRGGRLISKSAD